MHSGKTVVILQSNYIPWKGYFDLIHDADVFVFYDEVKYTKNDWRNRNKIKAANGDQWITIPISKDAVKLKISEVTIDSPQWQQLHYKTLALTYKRAPFFHQLEPLLNEFYVEREWKNLSEMNQFMIKRISELLGIKTKFTDSKSYDLNAERIDRLVNIIKQENGTRYISGPAAKDYLAGEEHLFSDKGIQLVYKDYSGYPTYKQMYEPFSHAVSIIDLIANVELNQINRYIWEKH